MNYMDESAYKVYQKKLFEENYGLGNKKILTIDILNGYIGYTSHCEENISFASSNFDNFLKELNSYLKELHKRHEIITADDKSEGV